MSVTADGDGFRVADDGPGIPAERRDRVFESGFSTDEEGTGIGLATVKRIAEAHDWEVAVSASETGGARFDFHGVDLVEGDRPDPTSGPGTR